MFSSNSFAAAIQNPRDEINARCLKLIGDLEQAEKLNDLYKERIASFETEIAEAKAAIEQGEGRVAERDSKIETLMVQKAELLAAQAGQQRRVDDLKEELSEVRDRAAVYLSQRNKAFVIGGVGGAFVGALATVAIRNRK